MSEIEHIMQLGIQEGSMPCKTDEGTLIYPQTIPGVIYSTAIKLIRMIGAGGEGIVYSTDACYKDGTPICVKCCDYNDSGRIQPAYELYKALNLPPQRQYPTYFHEENGKLYFIMKQLPGLALNTNGYKNIYDERLTAHPRKLISNIYEIVAYTIHDIIEIVLNDIIIANDFFTFSVDDAGRRDHIYDRGHMTRKDPSQKGYENLWTYTFGEYHISLFEHLKLAYGRDKEYISIMDQVVENIIGIIQENTSIPDECKKELVTMVTQAKDSYITHHENPC